MHCIPLAMKNHHHKIDIIQHFDSILCLEYLIRSKCFVYYYYYVGMYVHNYAKQKHPGCKKVLRQ